MYYIIKETCQKHPELNLAINNHYLNYGAAIGYTIRNKNKFLKHSLCTVILLLYLSLYYNIFLQLYSLSLGPAMFYGLTNHITY